MKFAIINPKKRTFEIVDVKDLAEAEKLAGLEPGKVDFSTLVTGLSIVVYEFGLYVPPAEQSYFAIGSQLYADNAVLFSYDPLGETVDLDWRFAHELKWFESAEDVEKAIAAGTVKRPQFSVNGEVVWEWPQKVLS